MHIIGFVDGPHVDLQAALVGVIHETLVDHRDAGLANRYLEAVDASGRGR